MLLLIVPVSAQTVQVISNTVQQGSNTVTTETQSQTYHGGKDLPDVTEVITTVTTKDKDGNKISVKTTVVTKRGGRNAFNSVQMITYDLIGDYTLVYTSDEFNDDGSLREHRENTETFSADGYQQSGTDTKTTHTDLDGKPAYKKTRQTYSKDKGYQDISAAPQHLWTGLYLGGELATNSGRVRSTETSSTTGTQTNQFSDSGDSIGVGIIAGFNFTPGNQKMVLGSFASFDYLNLTINHTFAGGTFLGTTTSWSSTVGIKAGVTSTPGVLLYGLGGVSWLNEDLNINFGGPITSQNTTVPGFVLGAGVEYQPILWRRVNSPITLFAQYQHTWWQGAKLTTPAASRGFNYAFPRQGDTFRVGVNLYL
jgi:hypothetical protein